MGHRIYGVVTIVSCQHDTLGISVEELLPSD